MDDSLRIIKRNRKHAHVFSGAHGDDCASCTAMSWNLESSCKEGGHGLGGLCLRCLLVFMRKRFKCEVEPGCDPISQRTRLWIVYWAVASACRWIDLARAREVWPLSLQSNLAVPRRTWRLIEKVHKRKKSYSSKMVYLVLRSIWNCYKTLTSSKAVTSWDAVESATVIRSL